ncbi:hypothetical protein RB653_000186 [Dictyostelium firmibasis]|uniref:DUF2135 domain-containing protein n=1 Tax=Dictyostelium firmibasis TaxID=79012 RepID=A0AAN7UF06_9MYCE
MSIELEENTEYSRGYLDSLLGSEVTKICKILGLKSTGVKPHLIKTILDFQNPNTKIKVQKTKSTTPKKETKKQIITKKSKTISVKKPTTNLVSKPSLKLSKAKTSKKTVGTPSSNKSTAPVISTTPEVSTAQEVSTTPEVSTTSTTESALSNTTATSAETAVESSTAVAASNQQDSDPDNEVIALRMNREGCNSGELHASLIWNDIADLDLHVITPSGEHLYYGKKESRCGGWLDKDMNVCVTQNSEHPIENIFWASAPSGKYKMYVNHFRCHTNSDPRFTDPKRSVPFRVRLIKEGSTTWFQGTVEPNKNVNCFEFNLKGSGAVGSFVVLPPNSVPSTFKELCIKNKVSYSQGEGFYALKRKEEISEIKDMVLHNTKSDTFIIGHLDVCLALNQPTNKRLTLRPEDLPQDTRLFVQSTSHNRKIPADTHVLMKVSVKEALTFRQSSKYSFR